MRPYQNHSNEQLMEELHASRSSELSSCVRVLRILQEVDRRRLFAELGYPSLFQFCVSALHLSEHAAFLRMTAARTARRFPVILEMLERGELHLTAIKLLAPHLTEENSGSLLGAAVHKTRRQVEEMLAARFPRPAVAESIRKLPSAAERPQPAVSAPISALPSTESAVPSNTTPSSAHEPGVLQSVPTKPELAEPCATPFGSTLVSPSQAQAALRRGSIEPLSSDRYAVRFTATARCRELIDRAKELMSHRSPNPDVAELVEAGLEALVEKLEKQKFKKTSRPRAPKKDPKNADQIPAEVARTVYDRDQGSCTYVSPTGRRCCSRSFLEFDHIVPLASGGKSTVGNLRLRCFAHNQRAAREHFGDVYVTLRSQGFRPVNRKSKQSHARAVRSSVQTGPAREQRCTPKDASAGVSEPPPSARQERSKPADAGAEVSSP